MSFSWNTRRPDMQKYPLDWEKSWESDVEKNFRVLSRFPGTLATLIPARMVTSFARDEALLNLEGDTKSVCKQQEDLARKAAQRAAEDDFERKWKALSASARQEIILEGLVRTMSLPDMEERRQWCPDSALSCLNADGGDGYLRMLRSLLPNDLSTRLTEPVFVPHPIVDRIFTPSQADLAQPGMKTMFRSLKVSRTYCLATLTWNIFLTFHGEKETQVPVRPPKSAMPLSLSRPEDRKAIKEINASRKTHDYACWNCGRSEKMLPSGSKLQACSKCLPLGRKVFYCSRECQVKNWKEGLPRPHKAICGKPMVEDEVDQPTEDKGPARTQDGIPPPDPSYLRSPALLHQISCILENHDQGLDYIIMAPYPDPDHGVHLGPPQVKMSRLTAATATWGLCSPVDRVEARVTSWGSKETDEIREGSSPYIQE